MKGIGDAGTDAGTGAFFGRREAAVLLAKREDCYLFHFAPLMRYGELTHAVVSRRGGFSRAPYASLNIGRRVGDDPSAVAANRERLQWMTGGPQIYTRQDHGTRIRVISRSRGESAASMSAPHAAADALVTDVPGVRLMIQTADCQAVMLFDPGRRVVANVHCGWRGSVADIIGRSVACMVDEFDCDPRRMIAAIGPSLGPCCAEFVNFETEIPSALWPFRVGRYHFDFWRISRHQLMAAGLSADHVHTAGICTRCNPHLFFSYRAAKQTGRFAAMIGLNAPANRRTREDA